MANSIVGLILAGGQSTRMGGGDKCLKKIDDTSTLLDVVISRLKRQTSDVVLNANGNPERFSAYNLPIIEDSIAGYAGPLAGILAGLKWAKTVGASHVVSVAADTPFFPHNLVEKLSKEATGLGLAIAASPDADGKIWRQPTFGIWPVALKDDLEHALSEQGVRKIVAWTDQHSAGQALFEAQDGLDPFFNVNTPEDLQLARSVAAQKGLV